MTTSSHARADGAGRFRRTEVQNGRRPTEEEFPSEQWTLQGRVNLFDVDPQLTAGPRARVSARVFKVASGPLTLPRSLGDALSHPFLVLKGLLVKDVSVCGRTTAELIAPGESVRFAGDPELTMLTVRATWAVLEAALLAEVAPAETCPRSVRQMVTTTLIARAVERADGLALQRSTCAQVRVDVRVLAYLWYLADRFGVVTPAGIRLRLPLTHAVLARLIGARRPTVTTALQRLAREGCIRRDGRDFILLGGPSSVEALAASSVPSEEGTFAGDLCS